ncbi:MAG: hypothetical protein ACK56F_22350 [bacterium]
MRDLPEVLIRQRIGTYKENVADHVTGQRHDGGGHHATDEQVGLA